MNDKSIRDSLSEGDRAKFEAGAEVLARLQKGFDDWVIVGQGLLPVKAAIMKIHRFRKAHGGLYNSVFSKALKATPYADLDNDTRSNLIFCMENLPAIEKMRDKWEPSVRANVMHPDSMRKRFREHTREGSNKEPRKSPMATLKEQYIEATAEVARLKDVVKNGSNLSPKDTYGDLARTLFTIITESGIKEKKALAMVKRLDELLREHYNKQRRDWEAAKRDDRSEAKQGEAGL